MCIKEIDTYIPASNWFAVGLLDGTWTGGKVTVAVKIESDMTKIHLVHILAETISRENGYRIIETCFAYCPEFDLFLPFASSAAAAKSVQKLFDNNKESITQAANESIKKSLA